MLILLKDRPLRILLFSIFLILTFLEGQECLIDGKKLFSVGSSEIVNGEKLSLFHCDDGHQMWLANYEIFNEPAKVDESASHIVLDKIEPNNHIQTIESSISVNTTDNKTTDNEIAIDNVSKKNKLVRKSAKLEINNVSISKSINIAKYGVETLLHKKLESDRLFNNSIEDEKDELLSLMNAQKRLFNSIEKMKPSFSYFKASIYSISLILLASFL
tara:strand:- start:96 stop:743 length:648 start_codon:yes stop_codon:yes gene_type:complete